MDVKKVLVVSDLQIGSRYSNWPSELEIKDGGRWILNPKQLLIRDAWDQMVKEVAPEEPDVLVVNGDVVEGHQEKQKGIPTITTDLSEQAEAAEIILKPLVDVCGETYVIKGTCYHDRNYAGPVDRVAKALGAVPFRKGQYTDWVLNLDVDGVILNFAHTISVATGLYRATPLDREGVWAALSGRSKVPDPDVIVRSHVHIYCHVEHSKKHIVITPGWQYQTEYQILKSYYRMQPEVGAVMIHVFPERKQNDEDPIIIQKLMVKLPREKATLYNTKKTGKRWRKRGK